MLPPCYLPGAKHGGGDEDNGDLLQKVPCMHCYPQCPQPCSRPPPTHASTRDSWTLAGKSGSVSCGVSVPFSGSWCTRFYLCLPRIYFLVICKFWQLYGGVDGYLLQDGLCRTQVCCTQSPCPCGSPLLTRTSTGDAQTQFCSVSVGYRKHYMPYICVNICELSLRNQLWYSKTLFIYNLISKRIRLILLD